MIRINLLGGPKPKTKRGVSAGAAVEGLNPMLVLLVALVLMVAINGTWYWRLNSEATRLADEHAQADIKRRELNEVKQRFEEANRTREHYRARYEVIDRLRTLQSGPVDLLSTIGDTVNRTDAVWLNVMREEGNQVNLEGMALSVHAVANLMRNLQNTGYFESVEMKESYQDEKVTETQAFIFTLSCEKRKTT